jgi:hypothetical protein
MTRRFFPLALLLAVSAHAQETPEGPPKPLSIQQETAMKCSAAFAIGATLQAKGGGKAWPTLMPRGREFMVRAAAAIMDQTGRTQEQVAAELTAQAKMLRAPGALDAAMGPCLLLLDASGL